jgi:sporulation protein YlmC with PRC-barrel domain
MRSILKHVSTALCMSTFLCVAATAQQAPAPKATPAQAQTAPAFKHSNEWRSSKLIGLNVYNQQNEKIGDINEILLTPDGRIAGVIIGVGGFLGMGEHDVLVKLNQLKFVNEAVRTSASTTPARPTPANTTGTGSAANTAADANRRDRAANEKWYPDHAVMNATKDQLKAMPQFKYN